MDIFQNYKNKSTLTTTPYNIAQQLVTVYSEIFTDSENRQYLGEVLLDSISHSSLNNFTASKEGIIRALYYLNRKLEAARKTISFWDAYQIRETITNRDLALGQLAQLPANSSVVSNLREPFIWYDSLNKPHTIRQGDILIKDYDENLHYIQTLSSGYYKPVSWTQGVNNVTITYAYKTNVSEGTNVDIEFPVNKTWIGYNNQYTLNPGDEADPPLLKLNNKTPIVRFYTTEGEEVFLDKNFSESGSNITITNTSAIILIAKVK